MLAVVLAEGLTRHSDSKKLRRFKVHLGLRLKRLSFACYFVLLKLFNGSEDVHVKVSTVEGGLASSILASGYVEGELAVVVKFVVGVVGTDEYFDVAHSTNFEF